MIKFLFLITEAIFFLIIGFLYHHAPESSYFWNNSLFGTYFGLYYQDVSKIIRSLGPVQIIMLFNILISWLSLIKKINKWIVNIVYLELIGIITMVPSAFAFYEDKKTSFVLFIALMSAIISFILSLTLKRIINPKTKISFLVLFTIISLFAICWLFLGMMLKSLGL